MNIQNEGTVALGATQLRVSPMGVGTNTWGARRGADPGKLPAFNALLNAGALGWRLSEGEMAEIEAAAP